MCYINRHFPYQLRNLDGYFTIKTKKCLNFVDYARGRGWAAIPEFKALRDPILAGHFGTDYTGA